MGKPLIVCLMFLLSVVTAELRAQTELTNDVKVQLNRYEDSLRVKLDSMYQAPIPEQRHAYTLQFIKQLKSALSLKGSQYYPFDTLAKFINVMTSPDKSFRIINWSIEWDGDSYRYFAVLQTMQDGKLYPMVDVSEDVTAGIVDSIFVGPRWYGGLIYNIIEKEVQGRRVYFLLTYNSTHLLINRKIVEPLYFDRGELVFGASLFNVPREFGVQPKRFVIEYKKEVKASLNWSIDFKAISFDLLMSATNEPGRKYTYVPSGGYDGLIWMNDKWNYKKDLIQIMNLEDGQDPVGGLDMPK